MGRAERKRYQHLLALTNGHDEVRHEIMDEWEEASAARDRETWEGLRRKLLKEIDQAIEIAEEMRDLAARPGTFGMFNFGATPEIQESVVLKLKDLHGAKLLIQIALFDEPEEPEEKKRPSTKRSRSSGRER